jgi:hypothetical protein
MMIFWDDMWNDSTWRTALTADASGINFDESSMSTTPVSDIGGPTSAVTLVYKEIPHSDIFGSVAYDWFPQRVRLAASSSIPTGASIVYTLKYTLSTAGLQTQVINPGEWTNIGVVTDSIIKMYLEVELTNGPGGGSSSKPSLYHLAMVIKD